MRDIKQLHPALQAKIVQLQQLCAQQGLALGIGECLRTVTEQDALYAQGRTKPGKKVTNARGSSYSSQHQWGVAFDFFKNVPGHAYDDTAFFRRVGALAKSIGLGWGGDWKSPVDMPHCYLPDWGSTTTKLKQQYGTPDKFFATWRNLQPAVINYKEADYPYVYRYEFYREKYPDLRKAFGDDRQKYINHFVNNGMKEGRQASEVFDPDYYRKKHSDLAKAFGNDLPAYYRHFINNGVHERRQGSATFSVMSYYYRYQDLRKVYRQGWAKYYAHYLASGIREHRIATGCTVLKNPVTSYNGNEYAAVYDYSYYIGKYADLRRAFGEDDFAMIEHFVARGMAEGRQASRGFKVQSYRKRYADLQRAFGSNLKAYYLHYINNGIREGRKGN